MKPEETIFDGISDSEMESISGGIAEVQSESQSDTIFHFVLQRNNGIAKSLHYRRILSQKMQHQAHSRLSSHSGQFGKFTHCLLQ